MNRLLDFWKVTNYIWKALVEYLDWSSYGSSRWKRQIMKDFIEGVWSEEVYDPHDCKMSCRVLKSVDKVECRWPVIQKGKVEIWTMPPSH